MDSLSDSSTGSGYTNLSTKKSSGSSLPSRKNDITPVSDTLDTANEYFDAAHNSKITLTTDYPKTSDSQDILDTASINTVETTDSPDISVKFERRQSKIYIEEATVKTQYEILNIMKDINFCSNLIEKCRKANVCGYVVFCEKTRSAFGEMEGTVRAINDIKNYLNTSYLPDPFIRRAKFSTYELENFPKRLQFTQAYIVNNEKKSENNPKEDVIEDLVDDEPESEEDSSSINNSI